MTGLISKKTGDSHLYRYGGKRCVIVYHMFPLLTKPARHYKIGIGTRNDISCIVNGGQI
jgi:hypothetical protein